MCVEVGGTVDVGVRRRSIDGSYETRIDLQLDEPGAWQQWRETSDFQSRREFHSSLPECRSLMDRTKVSSATTVGTDLNIVSFLALAGKTVAQLHRAHLGAHLAAAAFVSSSPSTHPTRYSYAQELAPCPQRPAATSPKLQLSE